MINVKSTVLHALNAYKAVNVQTINVTKLTDLTNYMVIATGTSTQHIKSIADNVVVESKKNDITPLGIEGERGSEWILIDLGDVVVHVMLQATREYYSLEKLWSTAEEFSAVN